MLTDEQIEKIKQVRTGKGKFDISSGYSYQHSLRALKETDWDIEKAIQLLRDTNEFGSFIVR